MTILEHLLRQAEEQPERIFVHTEHVSYTYQDFGSKVIRFASYLRSSCHVQPGERVVLCFPNEINYLVAYLACWYIGATAMPVDFDSREYTLAQIIDHAEPRLIVHSDKRTFHGIKANFLAFPIEQDYMSMPQTERIPFPDGIPALIMYTSGTTGAPKGVMLSHDSLLFSARRIIEWSGMKQEDTELTTLRLSHSFGLGHFHCYILLGAQIVLLENMSDPNRFFAFMSRYSVTGIPMTPAMIRMLITYHKARFQEVGNQLSYIVINTSPISEELLEELLELLPSTRVYMYYGLTEASRSTYIEYRKYMGKLGSVGTPPVGIEIRLDEESKEILIRGLNLMTGYLNQEQSFNEYGWFGTGDTGRIDEEGFLYVTGRIKEQINVDGLKINPYEVEKVLCMHPAVKECIVFGISDSTTHEKVVAAIVCQSTIDFSASLATELRRYCKQYLEIYKIPREIRAWLRLPYTDSGKLKRVEAKKVWEEVGVL